MELGEKLRKARLEMGMSQRALCGDVITRNMLSQIENGTAKPSIDTLCYLAEKLKKSAGYFLDEGGDSPNITTVTAMREAFQQGDYGKVLEVLKDYRIPDGVYDPERCLVEHLSCLAIAREAARDGRERYAMQLLKRAENLENQYYSEKIPELTQKRMRIQWSIPGSEKTGQWNVMALDQDLMLMAEHCLENGDHIRAAKRLEAVEEQDGRWQLLRGRAHLSAGEFSQAVECFKLAEDTMPRDACRYLEICYRELGDYRQAYHCACKIRELK